MNNKRLFSVIFVVFIDLLGFSLILPLLPYYAEKYGASQLVIGLLVASYAAMQLIGAPILGRLSDRFGRRPVLLASVGGTFAGFLLLGFADPLGSALARTFNPQAANLFVLAVLFISRMVDGLTGGNLSVAQAYISDVTDAQNRSKGLGMIGAAFGLGFIIGPATGGVLSQWGYAVPAFLAATLSFSNLMLIYFWLPESLTPEKRAQMPEKRPAVTVDALLKALQRPFSGSLLITRFFFGLDAVRLETTNTIELVQFVRADQLDPLFFDTPYYLGPDGPVAEEGDHARLLATVLHGVGDADRVQRLGADDDRDRQQALHPRRLQVPFLPPVVEEVRVAERLAAHERGAISRIKPGVGDACARVGVRCDRVSHARGNDGPAWRSAHAFSRRRWGRAASGRRSGRRPLRY